MKLVNAITVGALLFGLAGGALAEGGHERVKQFNEDFRNDQAQRWNDDGAAQAPQQVAQTTQEERDERNVQSQK
ncbi:hypothetical protein [Pseudomonas cremoricolorata]|uniref:Secreted protein n=1 Tax=Pseudomonas cremoricolorata TaxID=157783 RepID=A0A089WJW0_9PSED|nr:hypothetical protein [Pseudomonas cremoricolorata]AIR88891.1 hypothetical protein LK03_06255 [Pseudomonas cremoricolorata]